MHKRCGHTRLHGRPDVVVAPITDIQNLADLERHRLGDPLEELGVGFTGAPVIGRTDQVDVAGEQLPQDPPARTV